MTTDNTSSVNHSLNAETQDARGYNRARLVRRLIVAVIVVILLLVGYKATRLGIYSWQAYRSGMALLDIAHQGLTDDGIGAAQISLDELAAATGGLERELRPLAPMMHGFAPLPVVGGTMAAAPALLGAGNEFINLGREGLAVLGPKLAVTANSITLDALLAAVVATGPELAALEGQATDAVMALNNIPAHQLHPLLADKVAAAQSMAFALPVGLGMAPALPVLVGADEPKTYLLLIQNNHELRATGGFITASGLVTLDNGKPDELSFADSYQIYTKGGEYSPAPAPMQTYMGIELLLFRDANWSPDFPRAAQFVSAIYTRETEQVVDGVISVDLRAVELFFQGLGPLTIPDVDEPLTADNLVQQIKQFFEQPLDSDATLEDGYNGGWWKQRKDFIPTIAEAILLKLTNGNVDYVTLMRKSLQALDEGAIQIWLKDEDAALQMAASGWDGAIRPADDADYLLYVDTNMGYNKVDSVMARALTYAVSWPDGEDMPGVASTTMTYNHPIEVDGHECDQTPDYGSSYDDMSRRCYFDYVRLYVPGGSDLIDVAGVDPESVEQKRGESGTTVFSGFFVMEPGSEQRVSFTYRLPPNITPEAYRLVVNKQSGMASLPLRIKVGEEELETTLAQHRFELPTNSH